MEAPTSRRYLTELLCGRAKSHIDSDLIRWLVLVLARHERVTARRIVQLRRADDLLGGCHHLPRRLSVGHGLTLQRHPVGCPGP